MPEVPYEEMTTKQKKNYLFKAQLGYCTGCGVEFNFPVQMHLEHSYAPDMGVTLVDGGVEVAELRENHSLMCPPCNSRKQQKSWIGLIKENLRLGIITYEKGYPDAVDAYLYEWSLDPFSREVIERPWLDEDMDEYNKIKLTYENVLAAARGKG